MTRKSHLAAVAIALGITAGNASAETEFSGTAGRKQDNAHQSGPVLNTGRGTAGVFSPSQRLYGTPIEARGISAREDRPVAVPAQRAGPYLGTGAKTQNNADTNIN